MIRGYYCASAYLVNKMAGAEIDAEKRPAREICGLDLDRAAVARENCGSSREQPMFDGADGAFLFQDVTL
jgi:hypothetical protein